MPCYFLYQQTFTLNVKTKFDTWILWEFPRESTFHREPGKKHSRSGLTINLEGSYRTLKKQSSIPMKQKSDDLNSSHQTKTFQQTSKISHYPEFQVFFWIYVLNAVISGFFVCYINTFWCCLRSLRVLNSTFLPRYGSAVKRSWVLPGR